MVVGAAAGFTGLNQLVVILNVLFDASFDTHLMMLLIALVVPVINWSWFSPQLDARGQKNKILSTHNSSHVTFCLFERTFFVKRLFERAFFVKRCEDHLLLRLPVLQGHTKDCSN